MRGLELSRRFYAEAVRPILERDLPDFAHAAALIGYGSDVLGFDDDTSQDHEWGPRVQLFASDAFRKEEVEARLAVALPTSFAGFPTHFGPTEEPGVTRLAAVEAGPVAHRVQVLALRAYLEERLGVDPAAGFTVADWLVTPAQRLLETTAGGVFHDAIGDLTRVRGLLAWYPHDVWLFVMAGHWRRVAQLEHLLGRTATRGDDVGSRVIAASLARDLMRLSLLQERRYPPYPKWLGSAYARLERPERPALDASLSASDWPAREEAFVHVFEAVAQRHNELDVTETVEPTVRQFWGRPFRVLFADRFVDALRDAVSDPEVRAVEHLASSIDAVSDNVDVLTDPRVWRELAGLYHRR